ncbi:MAG: GNAT family N-acetyltransferase [Actinomycetota bacterium]
MSTGLRVVGTSALTDAERDVLAALFASAWPDGSFSPEDRRNMLGGRHVLLERAGRIVSHAAVVPRTLWADDRAIVCCYVEAIATWPDLQRRGFGTEVLRAVNDLVRDGYELGGLSTGSHGFYERLGWEVWRGPLAVRTPDGVVPTPEEDGGVLVLPTPRTGPLSLDATLACDWRPGDVW